MDLDVMNFLFKAKELEIIKAFKIPSQRNYIDLKAYQN